MNDKHWPFTRQSDYDAFNANLKSDNRQWKEQAIRAWIQARERWLHPLENTLLTGEKAARALLSRINKSRQPKEQGNADKNG